VTADPSETGPTPVTGVVSPRARSALIGMAGALSVTAVWVGSLAYGPYQITYGRHGWGQAEMVFLLHYVLFGLPGILLVTAGLTGAARGRLVALFERLPRLSVADGRALALGATALVFLAVTATRVGLLRDTAVTDDENVYAFMATVLASGRLYVPSLPEAIRPFFDNQFMINNGKWYGIYFPGYPAVLAAGEWLHVTRWVPAVAAALTVPIAFSATRRVFGQRAAVLVLPLMLLSPFFVFSSATFLAHSTVGLLFMAFVYAALRVSERPGAAGWWLAAGVALGWAGLTRPLSAAAFAAPWVGWLGWRLWKDRARQARRGVVLFCLVGAATLATFFAYNSALSGSPLTTGYHTFGRINGFSFTLGALPAPGPLPSLHELSYTLGRLNFWLLGWPLSLIFLPFFRRSTAGGLLFLGAAAVVVAYAVSTVPSINVVGPVHYADIVVPLLVLSASGIEGLVERVGAWGIPSLTPGHVLAASVTAMLCAALTFLPVYGSSLRAMSALARAPYDLVEERGLDNAVVFVHSLPALHVHPGAWVYFHRNASPDLSDRVLFVRYLGPERNTELMRYLPNRAPYAMGMRGTELVLRPIEP